MKLYLVRHGQSLGNVLGTFHGQTDYPLTEFGKLQARQVAEKLRGIPFTRCCASDLRRAWETALPCLEGRGIVPEACPDLREHFVGEMEDLTPEESERKCPGLLAAYIADWFHTPLPGAEDPQDLLRRVGQCVDGIVARGEDTLIAAHNGSLSVALFHLGLITEDMLACGFSLGQGTYTAVEATTHGAKLLDLDR